MGHRKKPGTPGKTTIPPEIVSSVTKRLLAEFTTRKYHIDHNLFVIPQQCYLYVEVERKEFGTVEPRPPITRSSTTHIPLGRLKFMGTADKWEYQPYRYSDECWDDREMERGAPEDLMLSIVLDRLRQPDFSRTPIAVRVEAYGRENEGLAERLEPAR